MFCRFCGTELPDTTRFCPNCYNPCGYEDMQNIPTSNNQSVQNRGTSRKQNIKVLRAKKFLLLCIGISIVFFMMFSKSADYKKATEFYRTSQYEKAMYLYDDLGNYKDSKEKARDCRYQCALVKYNEAVVGIEKAKKGNYSEIDLISISNDINRVNDLCEIINSIGYTIDTTKVSKELDELWNSLESNETETIVTEEKPNVSDTPVVDKNAIINVTAAEILKLAENKNFDGLPFNAATKEIYNVYENKRVKISGTIEDIVEGQVCMDGRNNYDGLIYLNCNDKGYNSVGANTSLVVYCKAKNLSNYSIGQKVEVTGVAHCYTYAVVIEDWMY